jgi:hypothetical protein
VVAGGWVLVARGVYGDLEEWWMSPSGVFVNSVAQIATYLNLRGLREYIFDIAAEQVCVGCRCHAVPARPRSRRTVVPCCALLQRCALDGRVTNAAPSRCARPQDPRMKDDKLPRSVWMLGVEYKLGGAPGSAGGESGLRPSPAFRP